MPVLVTGGAGFIGSHMVLALADAGEDVVVLDNLSTGFWWAVAPSATLIEGDIADEPLLDRLLKEQKIDAIIHFAGSIVVPESVADPLAYYLNNTAKSRALIAAAVRHKVARFVFSSTAAVYGNPGNEPVFEDAALKPISPYGTSKLMTEWMLRDSHAAYGLQYAALRYFNVAGADPQGRSGQSTPRATHLIKVACQTAIGSAPQIEVFGTDYDTPDGTCIRDYIHVSDLVEAHLDALRHLRRAARAACSTAAMAPAIRCSRSSGRSRRLPGGRLTCASSAAGPEIRKRSLPAPRRSGGRSAGSRDTRTSIRSSQAPSHGNSIC
jgi:UDP-glucose 4-epimerase